MYIFSNVTTFNYFIIKNKNLMKDKIVISIYLKETWNILKFKNN